MRTVVHLSDLHFGRVDAALLAPLRLCVQALSPDVVVVSGDLTQRAKSREFREARRFLESLPQPQVVVPGNHDVPLYNVVQRFLRPLAKWKRHIGEDEPVYLDDEIAVVGLNTARSAVFKGGRVNPAQVDHVRGKLCTLPNEVTKIVVTHHPFDLPPGGTRRDLVGRAEMAMKTFAQCGADILLSGHLHTTHTTHSAERYRIPGHSALIIQAGTATSTRGRGEANSFNALAIDRENVRIDRYSWDDGRLDFGVSQSEAFEHRRDGWHRK
jgi:3',5'-cyclic AMP phosphodiesterase CpdA